MFTFMPSNIVKLAFLLKKKNCIIHEIEYLHGFLVPFKLPFSLDFGFLVCYLVDASVNVIKIQNGGAGHRILYLTFFRSILSYSNSFSFSLFLIGGHLALCCGRSAHLVRF